MDMEVKQEFELKQTRQIFQWIIAVLLSLVVPLSAMNFYKFSQQTKRTRIVVEAAADTARQVVVLYSGVFCGEATNSVVMDND